ncbi:hypothetical protein UCDDA912_g05220 [Diaporthe ampelina]|uniref:Histone chaperone domain-containing protein n=1 Tax=Diaporthe ampelina TaxID=1214573 RepID=A0A0G2FL64_9PEZI|nr:hypothetical protein UCDDA912_g05220 [Diaporthe ampelina]
MSSNQNDETYNDYSTEGGQIPVQDDRLPVEDGVDAATADSDAQLERDDNEAIDKSNIVEYRTRGAKPEAGSYREPGDTEALPSE